MNILIIIFGCFVLVSAIAVAFYDIRHRNPDECGFFSKDHPTFDEWIAEQNKDQLELPDDH